MTRNRAEARATAQREIQLKPTRERCHLQPQSQQLDPASDSSTRRFCARPCAVSFGATGFVSPNLKKQMRPPRVMITDRLASYGAARHGECYNGPGIVTEM